MDENRRKLPSWMLGIKNNQNNSSNGCQKEEGSGKLVKPRRERKRVAEKKRENDDEFERESSDGGNRKIRRKGNADSGCVEGSGESREGKKKGRGFRDNVKGRIVDDMVDDGFERETSDLVVGFDGGNRRMRKGNGDSGCVEGNDEVREGKKKDRGVRHNVKGRIVVGMVDDEFELELSDVDVGCDGGNRRIRRIRSGDSGCVEGNDESREGKKKDRGVRENVKGRIVDDMVDDGIGNGKRKGSVKVRKGTLGSDDYGCVDVDGDNGILGGKKNIGGRQRKGRGKIDVAEGGKLELEEDDVEEDDGGGGQVLMRKCKGKRLADRGILVGSSEDLTIQDEDLTVEDLVRIAEEYVNKDMEAAQKHSLPQGILSIDNLTGIRKELTIEGEEIGENRTSETSINDNPHSGGSLNNKLLNGEEARPHSLLNENVTVMKPIMSGDPAQDMLDLFLGHLLKKPQEEKIKMDISLAVQRQEPVDPPVDAVPYTKKKSSLKDKVAMYFD